MVNGEVIFGYQLYREEDSFKKTNPMKEIANSTELAGKPWGWKEFNSKQKE